MFDLKRCVQFFRNLKFVLGYTIFGEFFLGELSVGYRLPFEAFAPVFVSEDKGSRTVNSIQSNM